MRQKTYRCTALLMRTCGQSQRVRSHLCFVSLMRLLEILVAQHVNKVNND
jgi:hypothetical protein